MKHLMTKLTNAFWSQGNDGVVGSCHHQERQFKHDW
jgi:hypothetical protein